MIYESKPDRSMGSTGSKVDSHDLLINSSRYVARILLWMGPRDILSYV